MNQRSVYSVMRKNRNFVLLNFLFWLIHYVVWLFFEPEIIEDIRTILINTFQYVIPITATFVFRYFYKRYRIQTMSFIYIIPIVIFFSLIGGVLWVKGIRVIINIIVGPEMGKNFIFEFYITVWRQSYAFIAWSAMYIGYKFYEEGVVQKQNAEKAKSAAQNAQLEMLRYQLNPHFLFNTLSSLRALIRKKDNQTAEDMVTKISEFLKYSLLEEDQNKVALAKEIKTINHYFDIEKIRFGDQLKIEYDIDPKSENISVPVFIIHPLIENAVKHGMKTSKAPLRILLRTRMIENRLKIEIINSGHWIEQDSHEDSTQTGLENTRKRLKLAYPENHSLEIIKKENTVHIRITINTNEN